MMAFCLNQPDLLVLFGIARGLFPIVFFSERPDSFYCRGLISLWLVLFSFCFALKKLFMIEILYILSIIAEIL